MNKNLGRLYLLPTTISNGDWQNTIPQFVRDKSIDLQHFVVEDIRTARRYLRRIGSKQDFDSMDFFILNKHTQAMDIPSFIQPCLDGYDMGLLSEAGVPCVADPGNEVVIAARQKGVQIIPMVGPSSIIMALMASGFNGQNFAFIGYLPIDKFARAKYFKLLEGRINNEDQTQIFIEAPYRNQKLLDEMLAKLSPQIKLCIAREISGEKELIEVHTIQEWKKSRKPEIQKQNTIFLLYK
ncbi:MAG: SAM-dependent methyltransferase [Bacteroidales bacterium]|nr:SAM-dependent methyltransferase [Bacteroidales bacterium]